MKNNQFQIEADDEISSKYCIQTIKNFFFFMQKYIYEQL